MRRSRYKTLWFVVSVLYLSLLGSCASPPVTSPIDNCLVGDPVDEIPPERREMSCTSPSGVSYQMQLSKINRRICFKLDEFRDYLKSCRCAK